MKEHSKFRQNEQQESVQRQRAANEGTKEFATVEEMLRFDATQNPAPTDVERKLKESIAREQPPSNWWQRLKNSLRGK